MSKSLEVSGPVWKDRQVVHLPGVVTMLSGARGVMKPYLMLPPFAM